MKKLILITTLILIVSLTFGQTRLLTGVIIGSAATPMKANITKVLSNGTNIGFYNGTVLLTPLSKDTLTVGGNIVQVIDSSYQKPGSYVPQYQFKTKPTQANPVKEIVQLGGDVKVTPIAVQLASATASLNLNDAQILWLLCDVIDSITVTSAVYNQAVAGTSVFDAYNGIGVYSISGTTATKIFETVNSLTLLTQAANTNVTISFPTPRLLVPGYYYIAVLGNWSTSNTLPALYSCNIGWLLSNIPLTNDLKIAGQTTTQASLPSTIQTSSIVATNYCPGVILK